MVRLLPPAAAISSGVCVEGRESGLNVCRDPGNAITGSKNCGIGDRLVREMGAADGVPYHDNRHLDHSALYPKHHPG